MTEQQTTEQQTTEQQTIEKSLRETCRALLSAGTVQVVIGYGKDGDSDSDPRPVFVTDPEAVDTLVFDERCHHNLTTYLTRSEVRALGRAAIVVKGCDERAIVVLEKESQIDRDQVHVIGVACAGIGQPTSPAVSSLRCAPAPAQRRGDRRRGQPAG